MSEVLQGKISAVRGKRAFVEAGRGIAAMIGLFVLLLAGGMLLDFYVELPRWMRAAMLAIDISACMYIVLAYVLAPIFMGPDEEDVALMVERAIPAFGTRLIASVQLGRADAIPAGVSGQIVAAMIQQTEELARPMNFAAVIKLEPLLKMSAMSVMVLVLGISGFIYAGDIGSDLLQRAFLGHVPVPRKTRINCLTREQIVAIGDTLVIEAEASGVIPPEGEVELKYSSGRKQTFTLDPVKGDWRKFTRTIENVQQTFTYAIYLNDARTERFKVEAVARPAVVGVDFIQNYPAYTRRTPERRSPGDLSLLAGSQLQVRLRASKAVRQGMAHLVGTDEKDIQLTLAGKDRSELVGTIPIPPAGLAGFTVRLVDDHGIGSRGETVYPVDIVPDKPPTVRVIWPDRKEELATQQAKLLVSFEAVDDFGIEKVFLRYHMMNASGGAEEKSIELDVADAQKAQDLRRVKRRYEFDLGVLKPSPAEGSVVEYWLEVQDGNNITGPGKASSDRYRAKIVSELEKRADLMNRLNDQLGTIDFVTQDQEKLNQNLGKLILEKK